MLVEVAAAVLGAAFGLIAGFFLAQALSKRELDAALRVADAQHSIKLQETQAQNVAVVQQAQAEAISKKAEAEIAAVQKTAEVQIAQAQADIDFKTARSDAMQAGRERKSIDASAFAELLADMLPSVVAKAEEKGVPIPEQVKIAASSDLGKGVAARMLAKQLKGLF